MSTTSLFFGFLGYSFINLIIECKREGEGEEPLIHSIAAVIGNYIGSAISFAIFYCVSNCIMSLLH